jgi:CRISPR/Cas system CMR subunit Cmr6 (Cas7 group RAMP superfamily)
MDLNPVALDPSASMPHIPKTDLKEILKMYGDAEVTVSEERES